MKESIITIKIKTNCKDEDVEDGLHDSIYDFLDKECLQDDDLENDILYILSEKGLLPENKGTFNSLGWVSLSISTYQDISKTKDKLSLDIDLKPIMETIHKYLEKKVKTEILDIFKSEGVDAFVDWDKKEIKVPEIEKRIENLEDWKNDIKQGFIKIDEGK